MKFKLFILALLIPLSASATDYTWIGPAAGDWFATTNWSTGVVPSTNDRALLGINAGASAAMGASNTAVKGIVFYDNWGNFTVTGTGTITLGTNGVARASSSNRNFHIYPNLTLTGAQTWYLQGLLSSSVEIHGAISDGNNGYLLTMGGMNSCPIYLDGNSTNFSGGIKVDYGRLYVQHNNAVGSGTITFATGTGIGSGINGVTTTNAINLNGTVNIDPPSGGTEILSGPMTLQTDVVMLATANASMQFTGNIGSGNRTLTLGSAGGFFNSGLFISPTVGNTYTGKTKLHYGYLFLGGSGNAIPGDFSLLPLGGTLEYVSLLGNERISDTALISVNPNNFNTLTFLELNNYTETVRAIEGYGGVIGVYNPSGSQPGGTNSIFKINNTSGVSTFAGVISDSGYWGGSYPQMVSVVKLGNGTEIFTGTNMYTGPTTISGGTMMVISNTPLPLSVTAINTTTENITIPSHGMVNGNRVVFKASSLPGGILTQRGAYYVVNASNDTFKVSTTLGGAAVDITSTGTVVVAYKPGALGAGGVVTVGTGGTLAVTNGITCRSITVGGGTLSGNGTFGESETITAGSFVTPGLSVGTLTFSSNLTIQAFSTLDYEFATTNASDFIQVSGQLGLGGNIRVTPLPGFGNGIYPLFGYGTITTNNTPRIILPTGYSGTLSTDDVAKKVYLNITSGPLRLVKSGTSLLNVGSNKLLISN
jgi:autotransporter-associated beta strand protein